MAAATRGLAEVINKNAAPQDRVTAESLRQRVLYNEGKAKCRNSTDGATDQNSDENSCNSCNIQTTDAVKQVETLVESGVSTKKAAEIVAEKTGKNPGSLRVAASRQKAKTRNPIKPCVDDPEEGDSQTVDDEPLESKIDTF